MSELGEEASESPGMRLQDGSLLIRVMTTAFLLLSGHHRSFWPDWPPRPPWPAGAYLEGREPPALGCSGGAGWEWPQGSCGAPEWGLRAPWVVLLIISDPSYE